MKPQEKSQTVDNALTILCGIDRKGSISGNACVMCYQPAIKFRDELSRREFSISGLCQRCQDKVFDV